MPPAGQGAPRSALHFCSFEVEGEGGRRRAALLPSSHLALCFGKGKRGIPEAQYAGHRWTPVVALLVSAWEAEGARPGVLASSPPIPFRRLGQRKNTGSDARAKLLTPLRCQLGSFAGSRAWPEAQTRNRGEECPLCWPTARSWFHVHWCSLWACCPEDGVLEGGVGASYS
jgi:hypothetical protein